MDQRATIMSYTDNTLTTEVLQIEVYSSSNVNDVAKGELEGHNEGSYFVSYFDTGYGADSNGPGSADDDNWSTSVFIKATTDMDYKYFVLNSIDLGYNSDSNTEIRVGSSFSKDLDPTYFTTRYGGDAAYDGYNSIFEGGLGSSIYLYLFDRDSSGSYYYENFTTGSDVDIKIDNISITPKYKPKLENFDSETLDYNRGTQMSIDSDATIVLDSDFSDGFNGGKIYTYLSNKKTGDEFIIDTTGRVSLSNGMSGGSVVSVDDVAIGTISTNYYGNGNGNTQNLMINFDSDEATTDRVQELVRSIYYYNADPSISEVDRTLNIYIEDTLTDYRDSVVTDRSNTYTKTINILPNTPPTLTTMTPLDGAIEDTAYTITYDDLIASGDEADTDPISTLGFRIESIADGTLTKDGVAITEGSTTIMQGESLVWTPSANNNGTITAFSLKAWDGYDPSDTAIDVNIDVTPVDDAPTISSNDTFSIDEANTTVDTVVASDIENEAITYSIIGSDDDGLFEIDTDTGVLSFIAAPNYETPTDSDSNNEYILTVQATAGALSTTQQITITVNNTQEAPIGANQSLTSIDEDDTTNNGTAISDLVVGFSDGDDTASSDDSRGIAITFVDTTKGRWEYSTDGGANWINLFGVSTTNAKLLSASDTNHRVRFIPNENYYGDATFSFRAWDMSSGVAGDSADVSTNGGTTAYSEDESTATISVAPINDTPIQGTLSDISMTKETIMDIPLSGSDVEGETITWSVSVAGADAADVVAEIVDGTTLRLTPATGVAWDHALSPTITITVEASDGETSSTQSFDILRINSAPVIADIADIVIDEDSGTTDINLSATDNEGHSYTYSVSGGSHSDVVASISGSTLSITPAANYYTTSAPIVLTVTAYDEYGASSQKSFSVTVSGANETPSFIELDESGNALSGFGDSGAISTALASNSNDRASSMIIQSDGKTVVAGISGYNRLVVVRYNSDGSLDTSFGGDGIVQPHTATIREPTSGQSRLSIAQLPNGKLVTLASYKDDVFIYMLNSDGTLDTSFGNNNGLKAFDWGRYTYVNSIQAQPDGKILVGGYASYPVIDGKTGSSKYKYDYVVMRLNSNGSLDRSFGGDGYWSYNSGNYKSDYLRDMVLQDDGKILITGSLNGTDINIMRLNSNGTLDTTFSDDGILTQNLGSNDYSYAIYPQSDGKILVAGEVNNDIMIMRVNADGSIDTTFNNSGYIVKNLGNIDELYDITVQDDGKIVVVGITNSPTYSVSNAYHDLLVMRYNSDGSLDTTFSDDGIFTYNYDSNNTSAYDYAYAVEMMGSDIVVAGYSTIDSYYDYTALRLDTNGVLKAAPVYTLNTTATYTENAESFVLDDDVKIYENDLSVLNSGSGDFAGASITLARSGGANSDDLFGISDSDAIFSIDGTTLMYEGQRFATYSYADGTLTVTFDSSEAIATTLLVNSVLSHLTYANSSDNPDTTVVVDWVFDDGNSGEQGSGGSASVTGSTTITITAINDAPTIDSVDDIIIPENSSTTFELSGSDLEGEAITYEISSDGTTWSSLAGSASTIQLSLSGTTVSVVPGVDYSNNTSPTRFYVRTVDASGLAGEAKSFNITIEGINAAPEFGLGDGVFVTPSGYTSGIAYYNNIIENEDGSIYLSYAIDEAQSMMTIDADGKSVVFEKRGTNYGSNTKYYNTGEGSFNISDNPYGEYLSVNGFKYTYNDTYYSQAKISVYDINGNEINSISFDMQDADGNDIYFQHTTAQVRTIDNVATYIYVVGFSTSTDSDKYDDYGGKMYAYTYKYLNNNFYQVGDVEEYDLSSGIKDKIQAEIYSVIDGDYMYVVSSDESNMGGSYTEQGVRVYKYYIGNIHGAMSIDSYKEINISSGYYEHQYANDVKIIDGSLYIYGSDHKTDKGYIAKLNPSDLSYDSSFGDNGILSVDSTSSTENVVQITDAGDGKLLVLTDIGSTMELTRIDATTGEIDTTFRNFEMSNSDYTLYRGKGLLVSSEGKIYIATQKASPRDIVLIRLNSDGTLDTTYHAPYALDGTPSYTENAVPLRLDSSVNVTDVELDRLNNGSGNYEGAYLVISRDGGSNANDDFSIKSGTVNSKTLTVDTTDGLIKYGTSVVARYSVTNGTLRIDFTSEEAIATTALVQNIMERIEYQNLSDNPETSALLNWSFSDGNIAGVQGSGGELKALGSTLVSITPVNDAPIINNSATKTIDEDTVGAITIDAQDLESEAMTYSLVDDGDVSTVLATLSGTTITLTPAANYNGGPVNITIRATDASGDSTDKTIAIDVNSINDVPTIDMGNTNLQSERTSTNTDASFVIDSLSVADVEDDASGTVTVVLSTKDIDGTRYANLNLATNVTGGISAGEISDNGTGVVTITSTIAKINTTLADANGLTYSANDGMDFVAKGADTLSLSITDSDGATSSATKAVYILPAKPTAHSQNYTIDEDSTTLSIDLSALVTDINGTNAQYTLGTGVVSDSDGSGGEITSFGGLTLNWSKELSVGTLSDDSANTFNDGLFVYDVNANANGVDTFLYQFTNSGGDSEVAQIAIYVLPVNDNPILDAIANQTLTEDTATTIALSSSDVENEEITYSVVGGSSETIVATIVDNNLLLTPAADFESSTPISFTVRATDASGGISEQTFSATVTGVADNPRITTIGNQNIDEDTITKIDISAYDPDGSAISYTLIESGSDESVKATINNSEITLTPATNYNGGPTTITFRVTDESGAYTDESFDVTVTAVNDAPILEPITTQILSEDTPLSITLNSSDIENENITYSVSGGSENSVRATISGNQLTLTPATNFNTNIPISFTITATDASGGTDTKSFSAIVNAVNDAPVIEDIADQTLSEDSGKVVNISVVDPEGNPITLEVSGGSADTITAQIVGNELRFTPASNYNTSTPISFTITATDSLGEVSTKVVNATVTAVNDAPISTMNSSFEVERTEENPYANLALNGLSISDIDDTNVTVTISSKDFGGGDYYGDLSIATNITGGISADEVSDNGTGIITITSTVDKINTTLNAIDSLIYRPDSGRDYVSTGADVITMVTTDSGGLSHSVSRNLYVLPAKPTANSENYILHEDDSAYTIDLATLVDDLNQSAPNFSLGLDNAPNSVSNPDGSGGLLSTIWNKLGFSQALSNGVLADDEADTFDDGRFVYTPNADANGIDTILYQYSSSGEESEVAQITIYLLPTNDAPTLSNIVDKTFDENTVNDTAQLIGSNIDYSDIDDEDLDGGMLSISGLRATESISISNQVVGVSGNIQLDGSDLQVSDGTNWTKFATFSGGVGGDLRVDFNSNATVDIVSDLLKLMTYQSSSQSGESTHALSIKISDGDGLDTGVEELNITVTSQNDAPTIGEIGNQSVNLRETLVLNYSATDVEGDEITYSISGGGSDSVVATIQDGTIIFTQAEAYEGGDVEFTLTATDINGDSSDEVFTLSVNQAPVLDNPVDNQAFDGSGDWTFSYADDTFSDPEGAQIRYSAKLADGRDLPSWLRFDSTTREFRGNPPAGVESLDISIIATDDKDVSKHDTYEVVFTSTNDIPIVSNHIGNKAHDGEGNWEYTLDSDIFSDADGDTLTYSVTLSDGSDLPHWLRYDSENNKFIGNPPNGIDTLDIKISVTDGSDSEVSDTFTLDITNANDRPTVVDTILSDEIKTTDELTLELSELFSDLDVGDTLSYSATDLPEGLSIDPDTGTLSGKVSTAGEYQITLEATDSIATTTKSYALVVSQQAIAGGAAVSEIIEEPQEGEDSDDNSEDNKSDEKDDQNSEDTNNNDNKPNDTEVPKDDDTDKKPATYIPIEEVIPTTEDKPVEIDIKEIIEAKETNYIEDTTNTNSIYTTTNIDTLTATNDINYEAKYTIDENISEQSIDHEAIKEIIKEIPNEPIAKANIEPTIDIPNKLDPNVLIADLDINVDTNGQVHYAQDNVIQMASIGMSIDNIVYKDEYIEIKIVDTQINQEYEVTLKDGKPLPSTLEFDPISGKVSGRLPDGQKELDISIKATSSDGKVRVLSVKIDANSIKDQDMTKQSNLKDDVQKQSFNMNNYGDHVMKIFDTKVV
jgi:uncharacterized delta-60 repeat protein